MNDIVIRAVDLTKVYRLYRKPSYRFRDMFGLLGTKRDAFTEHAALDGVNLEIRRGEKVAIIGRNGAGKSTLLKLVTNVIQLTSGVLDVKGHIHALLQIGTGFHPDFTGRENVYAYFAQLGITGKDADRRCAEAVDFAELEEYIDQPLKTYSTGMAVRLMFAASTAMTPDLLVLDEVLGVGDAYFAQKSFDRMRELCEQHGSTLLLVTHDIYSAVRLCPRLVWIERGRVLLDGPGAEVVNAYENSIRRQEEERLRLKAHQRAAELAAAVEPTAPVSAIGVEVHAAANIPQPVPVYFSRIDVFGEHGRLGTVPLDGTDVSNVALQLEGCCWSDPVMWHGRPARALLNFGSPFHKVAAVVTAPASPSIAIEVDYWMDEPCVLMVHGFRDGREIAIGEMPPAAGAWATFRTDDHSAGVRPADTLAAGAAGRQGTGAIVITSLRPLDAHGRERFTFRYGDPFELDIGFRINEPKLREHAQVLVAFHRDGVQDVMRAVTRELLFDEAVARHGVLRMQFERLPIGNGTYTVTIMIAREGYYDEQQTAYFSLNPGVYTCLTRAFEIVVEGGGIVATGTGVVADAQWRLVPAAAAGTPA